MAISKLQKGILACLIFLLFVPRIYSLSTLSQGNFQLSLNQNGSVGVRESSNYWSVELTSANLLNASGHILQYEGSGELGFNSNVDGTLKVTTNIDSLKLRLNGVVSGLASGSSFGFLNGDEVIIFWSIPLEPLFPFMFLIGVIGLASLMGSSVYGAWLIQHRDFNEDKLIMTLVMLTIGFALFIGWVTS